MKQENSEIGKKVLTDGLDPYLVHSYLITAAKLCRLVDGYNFHHTDWHVKVNSCTQKKLWAL